MKKLNEQQESEICKEYVIDQKSTARSIAKKYHVSKETIYKLLNHNNIKKLINYQRRYSYNDNYFDVINTPEKAQVLGLMFSDGYNNTNRNSVHIHLNEKDKEYLMKIKDLLECTQPLGLSKTITRKNKLICNMLRLDIYSKHMSENLCKLGCNNRKSLTLIFPNDNQVPKSLIKYFILGYIEGDGYIGSDKKGNFAVHIVGTKEFLSTLAMILKESLDINSYLNQKNKHLNKNSYNLQIGGNIQVLKMLIWLYDKTSFYMERKYKQYQILMSKYQRPTKSISTKKLINYVRKPLESMGIETGLQHF